jgi:hypothetical protein
MVMFNDFLHKYKSNGFVKISVLLIYVAESCQYNLTMLFRLHDHNNIFYEDVLCS